MVEREGRKEVAKMRRVARNSRWNLTCPRFWKSFSSMIGWQWQNIITCNATTKSKCCRTSRRIRKATKPPQTSKLLWSSPRDQSVTLFRTRSICSSQTWLLDRSESHNWDWERDVFDLCCWTSFADACQSWRAPNGLLSTLVCRLRTTTSWKMCLIYVKFYFDCWRHCKKQYTSTPVSYRWTIWDATALETILRANYWISWKLPAQIHVNIQVFLWLQWRRSDNQHTSIL
jgi:hypothetical protein